ncbi:hypothetical protein [Actinomadura kijaniata]|uniref:hypothetical protein n=1 Tax=Actinomadura kijaniata TaxID=46161 RepID=UPI0008371DC6|nr:hypothetical protein [Actinomadura kijaniata]
MRHTLPALTLAAVALTSAVAAPAEAAARRAPGVKIAPGTVVLQAKSSTWVTVTVTAPGMGPGSWIDFDLRGPKGDWVGDAVIEDPDGDGVFVGRGKFDRSSEPGSWRAETSVYDTNEGSTKPGPSTTFSVKRSTRLSANAGPEPVRKGRTLTVAGRLTRLDPYGWNGDYVGYGKQRVSVYFRKRGTGKWVYAGAATTASNGSYKRTFKAKYDGTWRAGYWGSSLFFKSVSGDDYIDVR